MTALAGRGAEIEAIAAVLGHASDGLRALVLKGEAGIGKTTLWHEAVRRGAAGGGMVMQTRPGSAERDLTFSGLADLMHDIGAAELDALPEPQRAAMEAATLRAVTDGARPDGRTVGRALLSILQAVTARGPLIIAIDDTQWLDVATARAVAFAVRRAETLPVTLVLARRPDPHPVDLLADLPRAAVRHLTVGPLGREDLEAIVAVHVRSRPGPSVMNRITAASGGNPFHALELARALEHGPPPDGSLPVSRERRRLAAARMRRLPRTTRHALLVASALAHPTTALIAPSELGPAEEAGIVGVRVDGTIAFTHPLFAEAVYAAASRPVRRALHERLADLVGTSEERAHHLALSVDGPDDAVAVALDGAAAAAAQRGAPDIATEFAHQAASRTPPDRPADVARRLITAGHHQLTAGGIEAAISLAREAVEAQPHGASRAEARYLEAKGLAHLHPDAARAALADALAHADGDPGLAARVELANGLMGFAIGRPLEARAHLVEALRLAGVTGDTQVIAEALAFHEASGVFTALGVDETRLARALELEDRSAPPSHILRPSLVVGATFLFMGRLARARGILLDHLAWTSERGEESALAWSEGYLAIAGFLEGELDEASRRADATVRAARLTGTVIHIPWAEAFLAMVAVLRGDLPRARDLARRGLEGAERIGWPDGLRQARWACAQLALAEADPRAALEFLEEDTRGVEAAGVFEWPAAFFIPEAVEAMVACGEAGRAGALADGLAVFGHERGRPWAVLAGARGRALVRAADGDLTGALDALEAGLAVDEVEMPIELARTLLVRGQIERRLKRRAAAARTLAAARALFDRSGADGLVARVDSEVARLGTRGGGPGLTPNEHRIAGLAADGLSNADIAARLFISLRTVEANLSRVYAKLAIRSRAQLAQRLTGADESTRIRQPDHVEPGDGLR